MKTKSNHKHYIYILKQGKCCRVKICVDSLRKDKFDE